MVKYRNARVKLAEVLIMFLGLPGAAALLPLMVFWSDSTAFVMTFALIYGLIGFNVAFFLWDTKNVPHTVVFEDGRVVLRMRNREEAYRWDEVDDLLWKRVLSKRSVVGLFMKDGREVWVRSVNPRIAGKMDSFWQDWKKV